ncbi:MAG: hypothetical protein HXS41_05065 [Theionarchaea archaeon]|nr:hypothetical protein [Theionarchaea archaeon]MBU7001919.1 hypothetical protein [Theionarchaea archaeon]MBU7020406.1 hypothetical protein [Theionarchaea archaeon]
MIFKKENATLFLFGVLSIDILIVIMFMWNGEIPYQTDLILVGFIGSLATISALIFTIPLLFRNSREGTIYSRSDENLVICYLCMFILGIFLSLLTLFIENDTGFFEVLTGGSFEPEPFFFRLSVAIFLICLVWLIPYLFIFLRRDTIKVMVYLRNSILDNLNHIQRNGGKKLEETIKKEINRLERIILQVLSSHNYIALDYGISSLVDITGKIIGKPERSSRFIKLMEKAIRQSSINDKVGNSLLKEVMRSLRDVSIACIECRSDEYSRRIGKYMKEVVLDGLRTRRNFEYPNLVLNIEKLGVEAARSNLEETTDEILNSLGQIGDQSISLELQRSPILAVLKGLQDIGVICTKEKMIYQCATARTRMLGIARRGDRSVREEALRRFWVVTAYMYRNVPEIKEANYVLEATLGREFGPMLSEQLDKALDTLHRESDWTGKQVLKDFKNSKEFSYIFENK